MSPLSNIPGEYPSSNDESCSDITLNEEPDVPQRSYRRDSLTAWSEEGDEPVSPSSFPFHLISGCSAAERDMCQYSGSITSPMVQAPRRIGLKGTLTWRCGPPNPHQILSRARGGGPLEVPSSHRARCFRHHATCRNSSCDIGRSRADSANDSSAAR